MNPTQLKTLKDIGYRGILLSLILEPDGQTLLAGGSDGKVLRFALSDEQSKPEELSGHTSYVTGLARAGDAVVSGAYDRQLIWWNVSERKPQRTLDDAHGKWIRDVVASPDGRLVASTADDMVCKLWDAASGQLVRELKGHEAKTPTHYPSMLFCCAFSPDGKHLATADKTGRIVVWDVDSGKEVVRLDGSGMYTWDPRQRRHSIGGVRALAFSPDGEQLAAGGMGQVGNIDHLEGKARFELFDWRQGKQTAVVEDDKYKGLVEELRYSRDGKWLLAAGGAGDGFMLFHDLAAGKTAHQHKAPMHVHDVALGDDEQKLYAVGHGKLVVWQLGG